MQGQEFLTREGEVEYGLTPLQILRIFYLMTALDLAELKDEVRPMIVRFQERMRTALTAARLATGREPDLDKILAKVGRVDLFNAAIDRACGLPIDAAKMPGADVLSQCLTGEGA